MNIGIVGGTFDPFHHGHLEPVLASRETMQWDRILYVPAHRQPFKVTNDSTPDWHRWAMLILATLDLDGVHASDVELLRGDVSYTVDTLEQLRAQYPEATLDWIIGDDNLAKLDQWKNVDRIFEFANLAVLSRHGAPPPSAANRDAGEGGEASQKHRTLHDPRERKTHGSIVFTRNATVPISATDIRNRVRAGQPIDAFVDPRVSRYIAHYGLYKGTT